MFAPSLWCENDIITYSLLCASFLLSTNWQLKWSSIGTKKNFFFNSAAVAGGAVRTHAICLENKQRWIENHSHTYTLNSYTCRRAQVFYVHKQKKKMKVENFREFLFLSFSTAAIGAVICWNYFVRYFFRKLCCTLCLTLWPIFMLVLLCLVCGCHWRFRYWLLLFSFTFPVSFWLWFSYKNNNEIRYGWWRERECVYDVWLWTKSLVNFVCAVYVTKAPNRFGWPKWTSESLTVTAPYRRKEMENSVKYDYTSTSRTKHEFSITYKQTTSHIRTHQTKTDDNI